MAEILEATGRTVRRDRWVTELAVEAENAAMAAMAARLPHNMT